MRLIITRHGQTEQNKSKILQGQTPGALSNLGKEQARKVAERLKEEQIELDPTIASVDPSKCTLCDLCADICPFDAIRTEEYKGKKVALVIAASCKGCGMCTPVCPFDAIDLIGYTNNEIEGMIDSILTIDQPYG